MDEFRAVVRLLDRARRPEDIFGEPTGAPEQYLAEANRIRRRLVRIIAPDVNDNSPESTAAFQMLDQLWRQLQERIQAPAIVVQSKRHQYTVGAHIAAGDEADLYHCEYEADGAPHQGVFKVARNPGSNDLMRAEAEVVQHLHDLKRPDQAKYLPYLPAVVEGFGFREPGRPARRATVFNTDGLRDARRLYNLEEVRAAYPNGVHPKDMAWIWRRLLYVLGYVHERQVVHGAVLPPHVLIQPEEHGLVLIDWCYAVRDPVGTGAHIPAVVGEYRTWYPPGVLKKEAAVPGVDIIMAARCMVWLMGGDPETGLLPKVTGGTEQQPMPRGIQGFFRACLGAPRLQPHAWELGREFEDLIIRLWGRRRFRPFVMPTR